MGAQRSLWATLPASAGILKVGARAGVLKAVGLRPPTGKPLAAQALSRSQLEPRPMLRGMARAEVAMAGGVTPQPRMAGTTMALPLAGGAQAQQPLVAGRWLGPVGGAHAVLEASSRISKGVNRTARRVRTHVHAYGFAIVRCPASDTISVASDHRGRPQPLYSERVAFEVDQRELTVELVECFQRGSTLLQ